MGPTWGPPGSCRPQMGPMLAPWILLSGFLPAACGEAPCNSSGLAQIIPITITEPVHSMVSLVNCSQCCDQPREPLQCQGLSANTTTSVAFWKGKSDFEMLLSDRCVCSPGPKSNRVKQKPRIWFEFSCKVRSFRKVTPYIGATTAILCPPRSMALTVAAIWCMFGISVSRLQHSSTFMILLHKSK